ncbi:MAG: histidine--tRNA ligase, partial [Bacteroidia bacterium]
DEMVKRNYIFDTIKSVYQRYGYMPLETPTMENIETLLGKYGDEGDKLIFRILDNGDPLKGAVSSSLNSNYGEHLFDSSKFVNDISGKGLRYDLTVPFARYVVMHQNEITFPFKRYQIQPVWRADRPQKGRYREFYQCDADVIGSTSLLNEIELIQIIDDVFSNFGLKVLIKINNRKILNGIADYFEVQNNFSEFINIIDKIDKKELSEIEKDLQSINFNFEKLDDLPLFEFTVRTEQTANWEIMRMVLNDYEIAFRKCNSIIGLNGINEMLTIVNHFDQDKTNRNLLVDSEKISFTPHLARGLSYYTGTILEVTVNDPRTQFRSSILGGGRYDDLTGIFGLPNVSGVGISFGADRIYDVMEELKLFPESVAATTKILFVNFGKEEERYCLRLIQKVREAGINAELYPDQAKMKKQMSYADAKKIPYVALIGEEEMKTEMISLKNMITGEQEKISTQNLIAKLNNII